MLRGLAIALGLFLCASCGSRAPQSEQQPIPQQPVDVILEPLLSGLSSPLLLTNAKDGTRRNFIVEQQGRILVLQPGASAGSTFMDISNRVLSGGERGLLGLAFHPLYSQNGRFFVNYTREPDGATVVAEFNVSSTNPNLADPASEVELLVIDQPFANHNGGMLAFGPDNFLYIGVGDGGAGNDPQNRAQNAEDLLGKILRIDVDTASSESIRYSSPASNPFFGQTPGRDEIFALGLRNPWRFSFDRANGRLFVGDVGQGAIEEIDIVTAGGNYGWRIFEGTQCTGLDPASCSLQALLPPVTEYTHQSGRCSVSGGYVYRGLRSSLPLGAYLFGDFCTGEIFMLHNGQQTLLLDTDLLISSFGEDESGEIYVVGLGGSVARIASRTQSMVTQASFAMSPGSGITMPAGRPELPFATGYARIRVGTDKASILGIALSEWRRNGILTGEIALPAKRAILDGRFAAALNDATATGLAVANPNSRPVTLTCFFTDTLGRDFNRKVLRIPANAQLSAFLDESPLAVGKAFEGSFTFFASAPVSATAVRGQLSHSGEFLFTALPVVSPTSDSAVATAILHWMGGSGWVTQFVLVNPSNHQVRGTLELMTADGRPGDFLPYLIPPKSSCSISSALAGSSVRDGWARIAPAIGSPPSGIALVQRFGASGLAAQAGIRAIPPGTAFRGFWETSSVVRTRLKVANASDADTAVTIAATPLDGVGPIRKGILQLPPFGYSDVFLDEIPELRSVPSPFQGIVRITATTPIAATLIRHRTTERGEILMTELPPAEESSESGAAELFFAHMALGEEFQTQFHLVNSGPAEIREGTIDFFAHDGYALPLLLPRR